MRQREREGERERERERGREKTRQRMREREGFYPCVYTDVHVQNVYTKVFPYYNHLTDIISSFNNLCVV